VFTTDWQLGSGKYVLLTDTKHLFGFQQVAMIIKKSAATSQVVATINKVSKLLTTDAMIALNKAAGQQQIDPAKVAATFLKANHL
jgi:osmoprotectant transport system substrate-binding protein